MTLVKRLLQRPVRSKQLLQGPHGDQQPDAVQNYYDNLPLAPYVKYVYITCTKLTIREFVGSYHLGCP